MGQALCPTAFGAAGGVTLNPIALLCNSPLARIFSQVYLVLRSILWVAGFLFDLIGTVLFQITFPILQYAFIFLGAFINFMIGLLFGEFRIEFSIFLPVMLFIGSFVLWLFYPTYGCFVENVLAPFAKNIVPLVASLAPVAITIVNVLFRLWNSLVPLIGIIINILIEIFAVFFTLFTAILGQTDVFKLIDALFVIMIQLVMAFVNLLDSLVAVIPTMLAVFASVVGYCMTIIIESSPTLIPVIVWLVKIVFFVLVNLLGIIVKLCGAFSGGRLRNEGAPGAAHMPSYDSQGNGDMFENARPAANKYFTAESAELGAEDVEAVNQWNLLNPLGSYSYYRSRTGVSLEDLDVVHNVYDTAEALRINQQRDLFDDEQDAEDGWDEDTASLGDIQERAAHPHMSRSVPKYAKGDAKAHASAHGAKPHEFHSGKPLHEHMRHFKHKMNKKHIQGHYKVTDRPIHLDFAQKVMCRSRFCGGHGNVLPHPLEVINSDHDYSQGLFGFEKMSHDDHRRHFIYTTTLFHVTRRTIHHAVHRHYHKSDGSLRRHAATAFKGITGHETPHDFIEHLMTAGGKHPIDSLHSFVPVVHKLPIINWISNTFDPEPESLHQNWMDERFVFEAPNPEEDPLHVTMTHKRNLMHVTLATKKELMTRETGRTLMGITLADATGSQIMVGETAINTDTDRNADPNTEPALPVFKLVSLGDCVRKPGVKSKRSKLCLPEIPQQMGCFLRELIEDVYGGFYELKFCNYEPKCAEMGFCLQERPDNAFEVLIFVSNLDLFINLCWIRNGIVWVVSVLRIAFPIFDALLEVAATYVPGLYIITDFLTRLTPKAASLNQYVVCLPTFFYGLVLDIVLLFVFYLVIWPLISLAIRTVTRLWTLVEAFQSVLQAAAASSANSPAAMTFGSGGAPLRPVDSGYFVKPKARPAFRNPGDSMMPVDRNPAALQMVWSRIGGDIGYTVRSMALDVERSPEDITTEHPTADTEVTKADHEAIALLIECNILRHELCGQTDPDIQLDDLLFFERAWLGMLQSMHMSWTWARRYINKAEKQQKKANKTELIITNFWKGHHVHPGEI